MKNFLWGLGMAASLAAFAVVMVYANYHPPRSSADLEFADRCVDWAHQPIGRQHDDLDLAARCDRYFSIRSEHDDDEDTERWERREARLHSSASGTGQQ